MSQTTESLAKVPEQKGPGGAPQNLPTELTVAPDGAPQNLLTEPTEPTVVPGGAPQNLLTELTELTVVPGGAAQNLPTELTVAPGGALTAAAAPQLDLSTAAPAISAATPLQAAARGLTIAAEARWPESAADHTAPSLPGFIVSTFSPIAAETASRCLSRRSAAEAAPDAVTAVLITTSRGDRESAAHVARTVAAGGLLGPLLFFQSVPNAVAGHIAARWRLTGPVVCLADPASALDTVALLIEDGDADEALLLLIEQDPGGRDQAHAVLLQAARAAQGDTP